MEGGARNRVATRAVRHDGRATVARQDDIFSPHFALLRLRSPVLVDSLFRSNGFVIQVPFPHSFRNFSPTPPHAGSPVPGDSGGGGSRCAMPPLRDQVATLLRSGVVLSLKDVDDLADCFGRAPAAESLLVVSLVLKRLGVLFVNAAVTPFSPVLVVACSLTSAAVRRDIFPVSFWSVGAAEPEAVYGLSVVLSFSLTSRARDSLDAFGRWNLPLDAVVADCHRLAPDSILLMCWRDIVTCVQALRPLPSLESIAVLSGLARHGVQSAASLAVWEFALAHPEWIPLQEIASFLVGSPFIWHMRKQNMQRMLEQISAFSDVGFAVSLLLVEEKCSSVVDGETRCRLCSDLLRRSIDAPERWENEPMWNTMSAQQRHRFRQDVSALWSLVLRNLLPKFDVSRMKDIAAPFLFAEDVPSVDSLATQLCISLLCQAFAEMPRSAVLAEVESVVSRHGVSHRPVVLCLITDVSVSSPSLLWSPEADSSGILAFVLEGLATEGDLSARGMAARAVSRIPLGVVMPGLFRLSAKAVSGWVPAFGDLFSRHSTDPECDFAAFFDLFLDYYLDYCAGASAGAGDGDAAGMASNQGLVLRYLPAWLHYPSVVSLDSQKAAVRALLSKLVGRLSREKLVPVLACLGPVWSDVVITQFILPHVTSLLQKHDGSAASRSGDALDGGPVSELAVAAALLLLRSLPSGPLVSLSQSLAPVKPTASKDQATSEMALNPPPILSLLEAIAFGDKTTSPSLRRVAIEVFARWPAMQQQIMDRLTRCSCDAPSDLARQWQSVLFYLCCFLQTHFKCEPCVWAAALLDSMFDLLPGAPSSPQSTATAAAAADDNDNVAVAVAVASSLSQGVVECSAWLLIRGPPSLLLSFLAKIVSMRSRDDDGSGMSLTMAREAYVLPGLVRAVQLADLALLTDEVWRKEALEVLCTTAVATAASRTAARDAASRWSALALEVLFQYAFRMKDVLTEDEANRLSRVARRCLHRPGTSAAAASRWCALKLLGCVLVSSSAVEADDSLGVIDGICHLDPSPKLRQLAIEIRQAAVL